MAWFRKPSQNNQEHESPGLSWVTPFLPRDYWRTVVPSAFTVRTSEPVRPFVLSAAWIALTCCAKAGDLRLLQLDRSCKDTAAGDSLLV